MNNKLKISALICGALVLLGGLYAISSTPHTIEGVFTTIFSILFIILVKKQ